MMIYEPLIFQFERGIHGQFLYRKKLVCGTLCTFNNSQLSSVQ